MSSPAQTSQPEIVGIFNFFFSFPPEVKEVFFSTLQGLPTGLRIKLTCVRLTGLKKPKFFHMSNHGIETREYGRGRQFFKILDKEMINLWGIDGAKKMEYRKLYLVRNSRQDLDWGSRLLKSKKRCVEANFRQQDRAMGCRIRPDGP